MKYAEIKDMAGLDSARQKLTADIEAKGNEVISRWENLKEILAEEGKEIKEEARVKLLEKLNKLEKALAKEEAEDIDNQFGEA